MINVVLVGTTFVARDLAVRDSLLYVGRPRIVFALLRRLIVVVLGGLLVIILGYNFLLLLLDTFGNCGKIRTFSLKTLHALLHRLSSRTLPLSLSTIPLLARRCRSAGGRGIIAVLTI